ncbi:DNA cytosine methyltransferase [Vibrio harveyi]|uniref:DNA cytosine methyltransferase n=1 Tax=Vibrio harveyi TaxID=669 RepID=UPI001EFD0E09|nr:DNA cytosine methyltransferase [Vibrio harveyi]EKO3797958.1 DNA cytosine methyltransferase [Vibrio harveyi]ELV8772648.1 DNA cytosine methyltransferase [Vibrio harveyi]MCG9549000.1 DNA cytosine methyltransferase [Vibrio harveyi]
MTVKAIDLFAGAGGFTLSAIDAGVDVLAAIEFDNSAANTYKKNFIERMGRNIDLRAGAEEGDINNVDPVELRKSLGLQKGELDLILGGPPCQGFSTHRIKNAGVNDPRNALLLRYFEFVNEFQPKAFLVENVAGLLWKRHADYLQKFISLAESSGYVIKFRNMVNARDYGVPQSRKRVFIYGLKAELDSKEIEFPPAPTHFPINSGKTPEWVAAAKVFTKVPRKLYKVFWEQYFKDKSKYTYSEMCKLLENLPSGDRLSKKDRCNNYMKPSDMMVERFKATPLNGSREDAGEEHRLKCHSNGYKGHKDVYGRVLIHLPSNTVTTGCNNPSKGRFVHPWKDHGITLREAARLQTFPDSFVFYGNTTEQAKQIGNAVPCLLGTELIKRICEIL